MSTFPIATGDRRAIKLSGRLVQMCKAVAAMKGQSVRAYVERVLQPRLTEDFAALVGDVPQKERQDVPAH